MNALVLEGPADGRMVFVERYGSVFSVIEPPKVELPTPYYEGRPLIEIPPVERYDYKLQTVRSVHEGQMREHYFYTLKTMSAAEVIQHLISGYTKAANENR